MPTVTRTGTHAVLPLTAEALRELNAAVEDAEAGGTGTRLLEFFEAQLRAHGEPPLPAEFCWELSSTNWLTISRSK